MSKGRASEYIEDWRAKRDAEVEKRFVPSFKKELTSRHYDYMKAIEDYQIVFCTGPAGTGKTSLACQTAIKLFKDGQIKKIVITRPLIECGGKLGTLPGGVDEKMAMFIAPMVKAIIKIIGKVEYERMRLAEIIEIIPLEQMRGNTFDDAVVIIDEPQNAGFDQLHMALTRLGFGTRMVICGDLRQSDLNNFHSSLPLKGVIRKLQPKRIKGIHFITMTKEDVLRPNIVSQIDEALSEDFDEVCESNQTFETTTIGRVAEPAPSYIDIARTLGLPNPNNYPCSTKPVSKPRPTVKSKTSTASGGKKKSAG